MQGLGNCCLCPEIKIIDKKKIIKLDFIKKKINIKKLNYK
jgi:hypothetical protein